MTIAAPTFSQIKAQVASIRRKVPEARVIGIASAGRWSGQRIHREADETYVIDQCDSPLAMRIALRDQESGITSILITGLNESELDDDILVRLTKRRLFPVDSWQIVKSLFQAHSIDHRITRHAWIAEHLLELMPTEGYAPAAGGFLDADRVWGTLLRSRLGFSSGRPDLVAILRWSTDPESVARWRSAPEPLRLATAKWLIQSAGAVAGPVLTCVASQDNPDAVPIGLASGVVFHRAIGGQLDKAKGKMEERFFSGATLDGPALGRWHTAATELVRLHLTDARLKRSILSRADEILSEIGATGFTHLSDTSPLGFDQRLATFGDQLVRCIDAGASDLTDLLTDVHNGILEHDRSQSEDRRIDRTYMAMRLARWSNQPALSDIEEPASLADAARHHLAQGGFVDWARLTLRAGDPVQGLSEAYSKLFEHVTRRCEKHAHAFAKLLTHWTASGSTGSDVVPVEAVLDQVIAPIARERATLVIVIDGMSAAVWRELQADLRRHDWIALVPEGEVANRPVIATVPSVTEASRTSLLCGRLRRGDASVERKEFAEHAALLEHCRRDSPPILFHKASLQEAGDVVLASDVRREIGSSHRRIVGVVVNAVDDHLVKGEQIDTRWTRDEIRVLPALLHEARAAGRIVVLLSDHGHILDHGTKGRRYEDGGERWRKDEGELQDDELRVSGSRVVIPDSGSLIAPWTETVRYGIKKNGYHGGLTPQEMVISVTVMSAEDVQLDGWREAPIDLPSWWEGFVSEPVQEEIVQATPPASGFLFPVEDEDAGPNEVAPASSTADAPAWITKLLASPLFQDQRSTGGRAVPDDATFAMILSALDRRAGKMTSMALARELNRPLHRLAGLLAVTQRVLNVDGYAVLIRDEASDSIELNCELLCQQFDLN